jgi:DNA processing protein
VASGVLVRYDPRMPDTLPSLSYFLCFSRAQGIGPMRLRKLIDHFGTLAAAWAAEPFDLARAGLDSKSIGRVLTLRRETSPERELDRLSGSGVQALCWDDADYPALLKRIADPPPVIYVRGELLPSDALAVAIVGTRKATPYGRDVAEALAGDLARSGITIVSGLARGIDAYAHQAALDAGGRTIAVIACGVDRVYPPQHRLLAERVAAAGAIISDYPPGTAPEPANFPPRNRIISGLSLGTIVVEADVKSGSLITTGFAAEQGRDVFAVPGNIFSPSSRGANQLLAQGAAPVVSAQSVLEQLNLQGVDAMPRDVLLADPGLSEVERRIVAELSHEPVPVDAVVRALNLAPDAAMSMLAMLELRGVVRQSGGNGYVLCRQRGRQA